MIYQNVSRPELSLKYIISKLFDTVILHNNKKIIKPYELDIYIPKFKLAFEYDGLHWHNTETDNIKNKLCVENDITLIRIKDTDTIKNQLKINLNKINILCKMNINQEQIDNIAESDILSFTYDNILDYEKIKIITQKYKNYSEFKTEEYSLYRKLSRMKILNEYTDHMYKDVIFWDIEQCKKEISKYKTFKDFRKKSYNCYNYILKHN